MSEKPNTFKNTVARKKAVLKRAEEEKKPRKKPVKRKARRKTKRPRKRRTTKRIVKRMTRSERELIADRAIKMRKETDLELAARERLDERHYDKIISYLLDSHKSDTVPTVAAMRDKLGFSPQQLRRIMSQPAFIKLWNQRRKSWIRLLDRRLLNEAADMRTRKAMLEIRAVTAAAKALNLLIARVDDGSIKGAELRSLVDLARDWHDRGPTAEQKEAGREFKFIATQKNAVIMVNAQQEAGVDMRDILGGDVIDAEVLEDGNGNGENRGRGSTLATEPTGGTEGDGSGRAEPLHDPAEQAAGAESESV